MGEGSTARKFCLMREPRNYRKVIGFKILTCNKIIQTILILGLNAGSTKDRINHCIIIIAGKEILKVWPKVIIILYYIYKTKNTLTSLK